MKVKDLKTKKPWRRILPQSDISMRQDSVCSGEGRPLPSSIPVYQDDFLREYYPSGHRINDFMYYPDIYREEYADVLDEDGNPTGKRQRNVYVEHVPRYSFAFQQVITVKQLMHLCGNDMQFDLLISNPTKQQSDLMDEFRSGWLGKDMEIAFFEAMRSRKITGDGAIVFYIDKDKKMGWRRLSFADGDILYPHYDAITGKPTIFARSYTLINDEGNEEEWIDVWDEHMFTRYRKADGNGVKKIIRGILGLEGYDKVMSVPHGFPYCPVAYTRDEDGACWSGGQDSIEGFELSYSQMAHNNEAYGEPILYLQGDDVSVENGMNGTIKMLSMGREDKAGFLQSQSASESYQKQLDLAYKMIYEQTFTVIPPELKSGDLPAAALKILYSPAYEKASDDANMVQDFVNDLARMFAFAYGVEMGKSLDYTNLPIKAWVKPYVHVNASAEVADLAASVQNGFISRQTASERISYYSMPDEWARIMKEQKQQQQADLLTQLREKRAQQTAVETGNDGDNKNNTNED